MVPRSRVLGPGTTDGFATKDSTLLRKWIRQCWAKPAGGSISLIKRQIETARHARPGRGAAHLFDRHQPVGYTRQHTNLACLIEKTSGKKHQEGM